MARKDPAQRYPRAVDLISPLEPAPEIGCHVTYDLQTFASELQSLSSPTGIALYVVLALLVVLLSAVAGEPRMTFWAGVASVAFVAHWVSIPFRSTRRLLAKGYSRTWMTHALQVEVMRVGDAHPYEDNESSAPWPRGLTYGGLGLLGLGSCLALVRGSLLDVGQIVMILGGALLMGLSLGWTDGGRTTHDRRARFWLAVWQSRIGGWVVRLAGWCLPRRPTPAVEGPEIQTGRRLSFEEIRKIEASRDLVNLVPALQHLVAARINRIRACLNPEMHEGDRTARPPLDRAMRSRLERCREELDLVWRRLRRVELGDARERLEREYAELERACRTADAVLEAL